MEHNMLLPVPFIGCSLVLVLAAAAAAAVTAAAVEAVDVVKTIAG